MGLTNSEKHDFLLLHNFFALEIIMAIEHFFLWKYCIIFLFNCPFSPLKPMSGPIQILYAADLWEYPLIRLRESIIWFHLSDQWMLKFQRRMFMRCLCMMVELCGDILIWHMTKKLIKLLHTWYNMQFSFIFIYIILKFSKISHFVVLL